MGTSNVCLKLYRVNTPKFRSLKGVIGEVKTNIKLNGRGGGSKMQPWGVMGKILFLGLVEEKNSE